MRVFITGATGFVGSAVLGRLVGAGHDVYGLVQNDMAAARVKKAGASPVMGDLLVPSDWWRTVKESDVVISASSPYRITEKLSISEAVRRAESHREMVTNLLKASQSASVKAVILTNHVTALGNHGDKFASENFQVDPVGLARPIAETYWEIEKTARTLDVPTIEVFPGWTYGPGGWFTHYVVDGIRDGTARIVGSGENFMSLVHIDDLAEGFHMILDKMPVGERYCLTDANPMTQNEFYKMTANAMGMAKPAHEEYITFAARMGEVLAEAFDSSVRATSSKARKEIGFVPLFDNARHGIPDVLNTIGIETKLKRVVGF